MSISVLTPTPNHLLRFYFVGYVKEVSNLIHHQVVSLFGSGMGSTGVNMVVKSVYGELFATTNREWCTRGKKGLSETSRP